MSSKRYSVSAPELTEAQANKIQDMLCKYLPTNLPRVTDLPAPQSIEQLEFDLGTDWISGETDPTIGSASTTWPQGWITPPTEPKKCPAVDWESHKKKMKEEGRCVHCTALLPMSAMGMGDCPQCAP